MQLFFLYKSQTYVLGMLSKVVEDCPVQRMPTLESPDILNVKCFLVLPQL